MADYFLDQFCQETKQKAKRLSDEVRQALVSHPWEGNVRELRNIIERAIIFTKDDLITPEVLPREFSGKPGACVQGLGAGFFQGKGGPDQGEDLKTALDQFETGLIRSALEQTKGNKNRGRAAAGHQPLRPEPPHRTAEHPALGSPGMSGPQDQPLGITFFPEDNQFLLCGGSQFLGPGDIHLKSHVVQDFLGGHARVILIQKHHSGIRIKAHQSHVGDHRRGTGTRQICLSPGLGSLEPAGLVR